MAKSIWNELNSEIQYLEKTEQKNYEDNCNCYDPILYIVLNKDVEISVGEKMAVVSHLTSKFATNDFLYDSNYKMDALQREWLESFGGYGNTVILEADEETIYDNCMAAYDNIYFDKYIEDTFRVAHHNWKLDIPQHVGFAFFGIKNEMPKWIRKLDLI